MIKAVTTKPLDGQPEGTPREFDQADFDRLEAMGAVRLATAEDDAEAEQGGEKAAPATLNKAAPPVANKAARQPATKAL